MASNSSTVQSNDLEEEPLINLPSLVDLLVRVPLVRLEEAVEPLQTLVHGIKKRAILCKQETSLSMNDLTRDESASIRLLTMPFATNANVHKILNQVVRAQNRRSLEPWFSYLKLLLTALKKLPDHRGTIYCYTSKSTLIKEYTSGKKTVWWGFNACTAGIPSMMENDSTTNKEPHLLFMIECCNGKRISEYSYFRENDDQILLLPGSRFEIRGHMNSEQRLRVLHLVQEQNPFMSSDRESRVRSFERSRMSKCL